MAVQGSTRNVSISEFWQISGVSGMGRSTRIAIRARGPVSFPRSAVDRIRIWFARGAALAARSDAICNARSYAGFAAGVYPLKNIESRLFAYISEGTANPRWRTIH